MAVSPRQKLRRQLRSFVFAWAGITFIIAAVTFIAIYQAYPALTGTAGSALRNIALPTATAGSAATLAPTDPGALPALTQVPAASTGDAQRADPAPITLRRFELGTQVQVIGDRMAEWMNVAANQLDVNWVKMQVRWELMEREPDNYDWLDTDTFIPAARAQNLNILLSIVTSPDWARDPDLTEEQHERHGPPADYGQYVEFVTLLLQRYPGDIAAVEVWNEQNLDREWTSSRGLNAADYVSLLRQTYAAIKQIDPGIIVVSGGLAPTGVSDGVTAVDDFLYFDQMIEAGLLNTTDCVGAHHNGINVSPAYRWDNLPDDPSATFRGPWDTPHHSWSFLSTLETYVTKIQLAGGTQQLCVTEFGWASAEGLAGVPQGLEFAYDNTEQEQRDFTVAALDYMSQSGDVRLAFLWNLNYGPLAGWSPENENVAYSIIAPEFRFRPVFDAVRDWNRAYEATASAS
jgi:hypothetical protein